MTRDEIVNSKKAEVTKVMSANAEMGNVVASHTFTRMRLDGAIERITGEIDAPTEHILPGFSEPMWVCHVQMKGLLPVTRISGRSSLNVIANGAVLMSHILTKLPFTDEFLESTQPNFGLPCLPTTTIEALAEKQNVAQANYERLMQRAQESKQQRAQEAPADANS